MITVIDVIKAMGIEPSNELTWAVGARVRSMWENEHCDLPPKQLRTKTGGGGSHCFAVYPEGWRERIRRVVQLHETEATRQGSLF